MEKLPQAVSKAFERLIIEYGSNLRIDEAKGKFYVHETLHFVDKDIGKKVNRSRYLGRITDDGFFIPARHKLVRRTKAMNSIEYEKLYDKFIEEKDGYENAEPSLSQSFTEGEKFILRALSMNCRVPTPYLSKFLGISAYGLRHDIASISNRLGIKYTLEIDLEKLGFTYYIVAVKFNDQKPDYGEIKRSVDAVPNVQLAMVCSGDYDLLMYVVVESGTEIAKNTFYDIRESLFPNYDSSWRIMLFYKTYGFVPLHTDFFKLLEKRVWRRTKEHPTRPAGMIWNREYNVLKDMCEDSRQSFTDIDSRRGMGQGSSRYAYQALVLNGTIIRPTIAITRFPVRYNTAIFVEKTNHTLWERDRVNILHNIIQETQGLDKYALVGDVKDPDGVIYIMSVMRDSDVDEAKKELIKAVERVDVRYLIITGIAKGMLGYRVFDNNYSSQRLILAEYYKEAMPKRMDYRLQIAKSKENNQMSA